MDKRLGISECYFGSYGVLNNLSLCKECGFDYIELKNLEDNLQTKDMIIALKEENRDAGIIFRSIHLPYSAKYDISSINEQARLNAVSAHKNIIKYAAVLNPYIAVIHPSYEPIAEENRDKCMDACIRSLMDLCAFAAQYDIKIAVECLPRTCLSNTSKEILYIIGQVKNNIGICFDTNHLTQESNCDFIANAGRHIITTHVSDFDGLDEKHWMPGAGVIDWKDLLNKLYGCGYDGPAVFEIEGQDMRLKEALILLKQTWSDISSSLSF